MDHPALVSRSWNGTPISRRTTDGYVNATAMCKANGKRWKDYRESDRCQHYLDALESVAGISVHALVESRVRHSYGLSSPTCPSADRQEKPDLTTSATMAVNQHWLRRGTRHHLQRAAALGGHR